MHTANVDYERARGIFNSAARFFVLIQLSAVIALFLQAGPAHASPICEPWADLRKKLEEQYGERLTGQGIAPNGSSLVLFAKPGQSRSFSFVYRPVRGDACLIGAGKNWEAIEPVEPARQAPAAGD